MLHFKMVKMGQFLNQKALTIKFLRSTKMPGCQMKVKMFHSAYNRLNRFQETERRSTELNPSEKQIFLPPDELWRVTLCDKGQLSNERQQQAGRCVTAHPEHPI